MYHSIPAVVWELLQWGEFIRCQHPSCNVGVDTMERDYAPQHPSCNMGVITVESEIMYDSIPVLIWELLQRTYFFTTASQLSLEN